ncbi:uncharacterized protein BO72DRAFT_198744 [Aspergillus fijiensis CBS 313.89]|uniref:Uncharacterized protein n=1 Tax=Aspergillus fijiensis CBS 313.89 TaxID=1448319 RepID=A0A8G1RM69_9EURO|nr:uncharacterized protein BO72DRAFT_198744 [Aspergillus fijiensis CBS 313.89]RAK74708.1 hypothetical protein BO72DRAFT_198744 [Aspergillus fijiensis CBS 313.89]
MQELGVAGLGLVGWNYPMVCCIRASTLGILQFLTCRPSLVLTALLMLRPLPSSASAESRLLFGGAAQVDSSRAATDVRPIGVMFKQPMWQPWVLRAPVPSAGIRIDASARIPVRKNPRRERLTVPSTSPYPSHRDGHILESPTLSLSHQN